MDRRWSRISPQRALALGFLLIILLGACLLTLPAANRDGQMLPFDGALFTSASATCVTGLVVCDTYTQFTFFGQLVILLLIQIGGLGFMLLAALWAMALGRRIGLKERSILMESVSAGQLGGVVHLSRRILIGTAIFEGAGTALLAIRFIPLYGTPEGLWNALFHAVSAFCNAGFDLMGRRAAYASLTAFSGDPLVLLTVSGLIIAGGIGFLVWSDMADNGLRFRRYRLHTRVMLAGTVGLIAASTVLFLLFERDHTLWGMPADTRLLNAFFMAVSPRTAGFNSVDLAGLSSGGALLTVVLMFVGAGPGSTAGGVKLPTVALALATAYSYYRQRGEVELGGRRLPPELVRRALSAVTLYLTVALIGCLTILLVKDAPLSDALIRVFSALSTVGLSASPTRGLSLVSRVALMALMFCGRVGSLSVMMAVVRPMSARTRLPEEGLII